MDKVEKKQGYLMLFLDKDKIDFYQSINGNILSFPFNQTVVSFLDIINPQEFQNQMNAFISQNGIQPADGIIIISPKALFEKDLYTEGMTLEQIENSTKDFLSTVPFEEVVSKNITFQGGIRISATNKNLLNTVKTIFEKAGSTMHGATPYESLGANLSTIASLDNQNAQEILKKFDYLKSQVFAEDKPLKRGTPENQTISPQVKNEPEMEDIKDVKEKPNKMRLYAMGGLFSLLILVLIYLILNPPT